MFEANLERTAECGKFRYILRKEVFIFQSEITAPILQKRIGAGKKLSSYTTGYRNSAEDKSIFGLMELEVFSMTKRCAPLDLAELAVRNRN
jgi:hypothetical protein